MSINQLAIEQREQFFEDHGDSVLVEGFFIFEDGATAENNSMGILSPPPENEYECAQLVTRFHQVMAEQATSEFEEFKGWLQGSGKRRDEWAKLYTDEDRLEHLRALQNKARLLRSRYARHRRELQQLTPEWLREAEQVDIELQTANAQFAQAVEDVKL